MLSFSYLLDVTLFQIYNPVLQDQLPEQHDLVTVAHTFLSTTKKAIHWSQPLNFNIYLVNELINGLN